MTGVDFILASSSPRRQELIRQLGINARVVFPAIEEVRRPEESIDAYVARNAAGKAQAVSAVLDDGESRNDDSGHSTATMIHTGPSKRIIIAADTIVDLAGMLLEKPSDRADAARMLRLLSGSTHRVLSVIHVIARVSGRAIDEQVSIAVETDVTFKALSAPEIAWYINTGEPMDKAGSYAAQGLGNYFVKSIRGSYTNVVGLPMAELVEILTGRFGLLLWG